MQRKNVLHPNSIKKFIKTFHTKGRFLWQDMVDNDMISKTQQHHR